jgi:hypothetical protein
MLAQRRHAILCSQPVTSQAAFIDNEFSRGIGAEYDGSWVGFAEDLPPANLRIRVQTFQSSAETPKAIRCLDTPKTCHYGFQHQSITLGEEVAVSTEVVRNHHLQGLQRGCRFEDLVRSEAI